MVTGYIRKRGTRDADAGTVCPDLVIFREFQLKNRRLRMNLSGCGVFLQTRGQKTRFDKKKSFKILLEIVQIYGDGRGFQNLACFRTSRND